MDESWAKYWSNHSQNPNSGNPNSPGDAFSPFSQSSNAFQTAGLEGINLNAQFTVTAKLEVEEIATMSPSTKQRGGYNPAETTLVCRLYVEATCDSIKGADQEGASYWGDTRKKYNAQRSPSTIERDVRQIKSHFQRVQKDVKLWEAIYEKCQVNWASSISDAQITAKATEMYVVEHGSVFKYPYAWQVLRECQKYASIGEDIHSSKQSKGSDGRHTSTSSEPSISTRPQGQKAAKKDKGKKKAELSSDQTRACEAMENMVKVMSIFSQAQRDLADSIIMGKDTSGMNPDELAFHLKLVEDIKKHNNLP